MQTVIHRHALTTLSGLPCADPIAKSDFTELTASRFSTQKAKTIINLAAVPDATPLCQALRGHSRQTYRSD